MRSEKTDLHNTQGNFKVVHLLDGCFPVLEFDGILAICEEDDLPGPCLLVCEVPVLGLGGDDESVDSYDKDVCVSNQLAGHLKLTVSVRCRRLQRLQLGERASVWLAYGDVFLDVLIAAVLFVYDVVRLCIIASSNAEAGEACSLTLGAEQDHATLLGLPAVVDLLSCQ